MHANKEIYSLYIWTRREGERERGDGEREMLFQGVRLQMVSDLFFQSKKKKKRRI